MYNNRLIIDLCNNNNNIKFFFEIITANDGKKKIIYRKKLRDIYFTETTAIPPLLSERKAGRLSNCSYTYDVKSNRGYPSPRRWIVEKAKRSCTKKILYKRIPILSWLPDYDGKAAASDLVAGFTVGLTVIPQAIAYANVAGLPPQVCIVFLSRERNRFLRNHGF